MIATLIPIITGLGLITIVMPTWPRRWDWLLLQGTLAIGLGLGIHSCGFYWMAHIFPLTQNLTIGTDIILLILVLPVAYWRWRSTRPHPSQRQSAANPFSRYEKFLAVSLIALALFGLLSMIAAFVLEPHGRMDAWLIWNMRARFIFHGGENWAEAFSPLMGWSHPDYPPLISITVARAWFYAGQDNILAPMMLAALLTACTLGGLVAILSILKGRGSALWAGLILLVTIQLPLQGTYQMAVIPLAYFALMATGLTMLGSHAARPSLLTLAGSMAALAGWTKNEGLLFFVVLTAVLTVYVLVVDKSLRTRAYRPITAFLLGASPVLLTLIAFKVTLAPPNDLIAGQGASTLDRLLDLDRYRLVLKTMVGDYAAFAMGAPSVLIIYALFVGKSQRLKETFIPVAVFILMMGVYFMVYVTTPQDLAWHLQMSWDRLMMHFWPVLLLAYFAAFPAPRDALTR